MCTPPERPQLASCVLGVAVEVLGGSTAYSLNFGVNTCAASKYFPSSSLPEVGLRLPRKWGSGVGQTCAARPPARCPFWLRPGWD